MMPAHSETPRRTPRICDDDMREKICTRKHWAVWGRTKVNIVLAKPYSRGGLQRELLYEEYLVVVMRDIVSSTKNRVRNC